MMRSKHDQILYTTVLSPVSKTGSQNCRRTYNGNGHANVVYVH